MTVTAIENETKQSLDQLTRRFVNDCYCLRLLRFFGAHPNSRFNKLAIVHAVDENGSRLKVERALGHLMDQGLIKTCMENNCCLYMLTREEPSREMVLELAGLDWMQFQTVLKP